jgi:hypothetical protein
MVNQRVCFLVLVLTLSFFAGLCHAGGTREKLLLDAAVDNEFELPRQQQHQQQQQAAPSSSRFHPYNAELARTDKKHPPPPTSVREQPALTASKTNPPPTVPKTSSSKNEDDEDTHHNSEVSTQTSPTSPMTLVQNSVQVMSDRKYLHAVFIDWTGGEGSWSGFLIKTFCSAAIIATGKAFFTLVKNAILGV